MIFKERETGIEPATFSLGNGAQLKIKKHRVYGVHSEPPKTQQNRYRRSSLVLTRQKCGRTLAAFLDVAAHGRAGPGDDAQTGCG